MDIEGSVEEKRHGLYDDVLFYALHHFDITCFINRTTQRIENVKIIKYETKKTVAIINESANHKPHKITK